MNQEPELRAGPSLEKVYVRFENRTNRCVEIIWVNYTGKYIRYQLLRQGQYLDVNTYKSHPWLAFDVYTKDRLQLDHKYVYKAVPFNEYLENRNPAMIYPVIPPRRRILIPITLPMYSLRYRTLLEIRNMLKGTEQADDLDLPKHLKYELKKMITYRNQMVTEPFTVSI